MSRLYIMPLGREITTLDGNTLVRISSREYEWTMGLDRGSSRGTPFYDPDTGEAYLLNPQIMEVREPSGEKYISMVDLT